MEIKTARCIGVMEITRINVECPYCEHEMEIPYEEFVSEVGQPFTNNHKGVEMFCESCGESFELGEFEVQE